MNDVFAEPMTLDTTWQFQLLVAGNWEWYSQAEYRTEADCRAAASRVYGGTVEYRIIRHARMICGI